MKIEESTVVKTSYNHNMGMEFWSSETCIFLCGNYDIKKGDVVKCERDDKGFYKRIWRNGELICGDAFKAIHGEESGGSVVEVNKVKRYDRTFERLKDDREPMRVLNLYAGIGGNRKLWTDVEVTAVEFNEEIASIYKDYYPNDLVIVGDANAYLLKHYDEFDFIWGSPPCPSHSRVRMMASKHGDYEPILPDMTLWQEIIFLQEFSKCPFTIELDRHFFWANFKIQKWGFDKGERKHNQVKPTDKLYDYDLSKYKIKHDKIKILRNMVNPEVGLHVFNCAQNVFKKNSSQATLF